MPDQFLDNLDSHGFGLPAEGFDAIIVYAAMSFLAPERRMLLGDIPNVSMLKRFLTCAAGFAHTTRS